MHTGTVSRFPSFARRAFAINHGGNVTLSRSGPNAIPGAQHFYPAMGAPLLGVEGFEQASLSIETAKTLQGQWPGFKIVPAVERAAKMDRTFKNNVAVDDDLKSPFAIAEKQVQFLSFSAQHRFQQRALTKIEGVASVRGGHGLNRKHG